MHARGRSVRRALGTAALCAGALLGAGRGARADGAAGLEIPMQSGKAITGTVESFDDKEVVVLVGAGEHRRIPWQQLAPLGVFRVRGAQVKPDDGPGRLALAELASELGLYALARAEYERALALHALDAKAYQGAVEDAERRAIDAGVARAERAAELGDVAGALETARSLKLDFAGALTSRRIDELLVALEGRIRAREAEELKAAAEAEKASLDADRKKELLARSLEARRQTALGDQTADAARAQMPNGVVSRVRRLAEAADAAYVAARHELGRMRRIAKRDEPERADALARLGVLDKSEYRLLFDAAKFFWDARVFASADDFAARASYIDPVDPALLELRTELREHRIKYRVSAMSNAYPR